MSLLSRIRDQVNPFDGGKTYKNPNPKPKVNPYSRNEYAQPAQNIVQRGALGLSLGALRSFTGLGQGLSGLYDLATPGTGTNRYSKSLQNLAQQTDATAKAEQINPVMYKGSQAATDLLTLATPGAFTKGSQAANKVSQGNRAVEAAMKARTADLAAKGFGGRVAARGITNIAKPGYQAVNAGFTALQAGKEASQGQKVTPQGIGINLAVGGLAFPAAGALGRESLNVGVNKIPAALKPQKTPQNLLDKRNKAVVGFNSAMDKGKKVSAAAYDKEIKALDKQINKAKRPSILQTAPLDQRGSVQIPGAGKQNLPDSLPNDTPKLKTKQNRSFIETVKASQQTAPEVVGELKGKGQYAVKSNKVLLSQARAAIGKNYDEAYNTALTEPSDKAVAIATELIKHHQNRGEFQIAADIADKAAMNLTELGRGVQAASLYSKISPEGIVRYAAKQAQKANKKLAPDVAKQLTAMAKDVAKMPDGEDKAIAVQKMIALAKAQNPSSFGRKLVDVWKAGLLTAPTTHAGNIASNTMEAITKRGLVNPLAAAFDIPTSLVTGKRSRALTFRGTSGTTEGVKRGGKYLATGYDARNPLSKYELQDRTVFGENPIGKTADAYTQAVFRSLGAEDQPFYYAELKNALYSKGLAEAKNGGIPFSKQAAFAKEYVKNPSPEGLTAATEEAKRVVWANKTALGNAAAGFKRSTGSVGQFIIPFSQVPASIATRILERSPLGYVQATHEAIKGIQGKGFDQHLFTERLANATLGTAGAALVGKQLASNNMISLGYPATQKEQARWQAEGKQPYSVKLGGKWISLNYVQPFGSILAYGAAYEQAIKDGSSKAQAANTAAAEAAKSVTSQSFLKGVSGAVQAIQDPAQSAAQFFENTTGSVVPNLVKSVARATDPLQRQINGPTESIKAGVPGLRESLLPKQDVFGNDLSRSSSTANVLINPLRPSTIKSTPVTQEVDRLHNTDPSNSEMDVFPVPIKRTLSVEGKQVILNDKQRTQLQKVTGQATDLIWGSMIQSPEYAALSDIDKAKALKNMRLDLTQAVQRQYVTDNNLAAYSKAPNKYVQAILDGNLDINHYLTGSKLASNTKTAASKRSGRTSSKGSSKTNKTKITTVNLSSLNKKVANSKVKSVSLKSFVKKPGVTKIQKPRKI